MNVSRVRISSGENFVNNNIFLHIYFTRNALQEIKNEWQLNEVWQSSASLALTLPFHKKKPLDAIKMSRFKPTFKFIVSRRIFRQSRKIIFILEINHNLSGFT